VPDNFHREIGRNDNVEVAASMKTMGTNPGGKKERNTRSGVFATAAHA